MHVNKSTWFSTSYFAKMAMKKVFDELNANIEMIVPQLKDESLGKDSSEGFKADDFWLKAGNVIKMLSHEATKLCIMFSQPPVPSAKDIEPLVAGIEKALLGCASVMYSLPKTQGAAVRKALRDQLVKVILAFQTLINTIKNNGFQSSVEQMQQTGSVWEACDQFQKLPRDNQQALCGVIKAEYQLIRDALQEIEEALNEFEEDDADEEDEEQWKPQDLKYLNPAVGLIKAARSCLKKALPAVEASPASTPAHIVQLDQLCDRVAAVSPCVDDLVTVLYPPLNLQPLQEHVVVLQNLLLSLLEELKQSYVTGEADANWVEFLLKAVRHNADKIKATSS